MFSRDVVLGESVHDLSVELALGRDRTAGEAIDRDAHVRVGYAFVEPIDHGMRLELGQPDEAVLLGDLERRDEGAVDGVHQVDLFVRLTARWFSSARPSACEHSLWP